MTLKLKIIILGIILAIFASLSFTAYIQHQRAANLSKEVKSLKAALEICEAKLVVHAAAVAEGGKALAAAEKERQKRIAALTKQIDEIKKKKPPEPRNCEASVKWAIENKNDLNWDGNTP